MSREPRSEYTANAALSQRIEPRAVEHQRPASNGALWAVLVVLAGTGAGLLAGLAVGLLERIL
jgi:hypothetical protein